MVRLSFIVTIITVALACIAFSEEELYSDRYDNIDIEEILANEKQRMQYYNCFMDFVKCKTADASFFKEVIGEALQTQCRKCTEKQKVLLDRLVDWYTTNQPEQWEAFIKKTIENAQRKND